MKRAAHCYSAAIFIAVVSACALAAAVEAAPTLHIRSDAGRGVEILSGDRVLLNSPTEGLWSVATCWKDRWPDDWHHAKPSDVKQVGEWIVVAGRMELPGGALDLRDSYRMEGKLMHGVRRFTWRGSERLPQCTLSVRWIAPRARDAKPLLPGICYYGNPSGASTNAKAVIVHAGLPGDESLCEEHRYSAPWVSVEWRDDAAVEADNLRLAGKEADAPPARAWRGAAMHTLPSLAAGANRGDQWWSLGLASRENACELLSLSGPCTANGQRSVVKAYQRSFADYSDAWITLEPGAIVEKEFFLEAYPVLQRGSGFRTPLRTAMHLWSPYSTGGLPSYRQIIRDKYRYAQTRYRDRPNDPGFRNVDISRPGSQYKMGWSGQAEAPGYALLALERRLGDPRAKYMAVRSLDFLTTAPWNEHGFLLHYAPESGKWSGQSPVAQGQAMETIARAILAGRKRSAPQSPSAVLLDRVDTTPWEAFLKKACDIHAKRILRDDWLPISTNEAFFVSPLAKGYSLFGNGEFRQAAIKAAESYAARHLDMAEPYWGGTLDAQCEDKEGAWAAFEAFLAVYEMTKDRRYLQYAEHAMDVALTYVVLWDIDMPPGRLRDHALKTRGWTIVSAQNQHLDVYGVLIAPAVWRMGEYLHRDRLKRLAAVMYRSCGQMIDAEGSQGEQLQHTNFLQRGDMSNLSRARGGYAEDWTVFWITAHFLNAAAQFEEMGVDLDHIDAPAERP